MANEGCACTIGNVISQFVEHLVLGKDEYALMDMEAGIEHYNADHTSQTVVFGYRSNS